MLELKSKIRLLYRSDNNIKHTRIIYPILLLLILIASPFNSYAELTSGTTAPSGTLPIIYIDTENSVPITSRTEYLTAMLRLDPMDNSEIEPVGSEETPLPIQIRGRGHSSWKGDKKPYKLKLSKKISLMGMADNKHWALLKPSENSVAGLRLGKVFEMKWTPDFRPVEVVLNGDYIGLYFLTETIRIGKNRLNIFEQQDGETDPEVIPGGWLVEIDNYHDECQITIPENNKWNLTIKYHSPEDLSDEQMIWLRDEFKAINRAIYNEDKTSTDWEEYIDLESIARFFIIQEIMDNPDGFHGSFYLHKDRGPDSKWIAGPIWDLVCYNREKTDYTFRMKVHYAFTPHWIGELIQYADFCNEVSRIWEEMNPDSFEDLYLYIDDTLLPLGKAWEQDCERWGNDPEETVFIRSERIKTAIKRNIEWFSKNLPEVDPSGIKSFSEYEKNPVRKIYTLQGIPVGKIERDGNLSEILAPGLYIIDGKKIRVE